MLLLFFERTCFVITLLVFLLLVMLFQFIGITVKHEKHCVINYYRMRLRPPGQRLPSQSRLITYRIACKSQMLDNEEQNVINMCASTIIEALQ